MTNFDLLHLGIQLQQKLTDILLDFIPRIAGSIFLFFIGRWVIYKISFLVSVAMSRRELESSLQSFIHSLVKIGLHVILFISLFSLLGINITSFAAILAGLAVGIGAALNGTLGNFAGGVMLLIFKPFKIGDYIRVGDYAGKVTELGIFNTHLITNENNMVILANGAVSTGTIVNHSSQGKIQLVVRFEISHDTPYDQISSLVKHSLSEIPEILKEPEPQFGISHISKGYIEYVIRPYCLQIHQTKVETEILSRIKIYLDKHNIPYTNQWLSQG